MRTSTLLNGPNEATEAAEAGVGRSIRHHWRSFARSVAVVRRTDEPTRRLVLYHCRAVCKTTVVRQRVQPIDLAIPRFPSSLSTQHLCLGSLVTGINFQCLHDGTRAASSDHSAAARVDGEMLYSDGGTVAARMAAGRCVSQPLQPSFGAAVDA